MTLPTDTGGAETAWPLPHSHRPDDGYMYVMTEIHKARAGRDLNRGSASGLCIPGGAFPVRWPAVTENEFVPFELKRGHIGCASERA